MNKPWSLFQRFRDVLLWSTTRTYELYVALVSVALGLWIASPWVSLKDLVTWHAMSEMGSDSLWAVLFIIFGGTELAGLLWGHLSWRQHSMFYLSMLWLAVLVSSVMPGTYTPSQPVYGLLFVFSGWTSIRLGVVRE